MHAAQAAAAVGCGSGDESRVYARVSPSNRSPRINFISYMASLRPATGRPSSSSTVGVSGTKDRRRPSTRC